MTQPNTNGNGISENTTVRASLYRTIVVFVSVISITAYTVVFAVTLRNDIDGKADKEEFEKYKVADSVTTRVILEKLQDIDYNLKKLVKKNNVREDD